MSQDPRYNQQQHLSYKQRHNNDHHYSNNGNSHHNNHHTQQQSQPPQQPPQQQPQQPPQQQTKKKMPRYSAERVIGSGSFGVVYKAVQIQSRQTVAIKKVREDR
eukprot:516791_1